MTEEITEVDFLNTLTVIRGLTWKGLSFIHMMNGLWTD